MIRYIVFFFALSCTTLFSQNTVGTISLSSGAYDGFTLFSVNTKTFLIDNCGRVINEWNSSYLPGHSVYVLSDGKIIRAGRKDTSSIGFGGVGGIVEIFDWEGNLIWEFDYSTDQHRLHHDIYPLPNGNILMLAATRITNSEAIQAGRDPNLLSEGDLYNERILEVQPLENNDFNIVWEWNVSDHLVQDFDSTKDNFGVVSDSPNRLDINFYNNNSTGQNWLHVNSIQYNDELDQIVISSRNLSEIWIIDHSTTTAEAATSTGGIYGKGGDFLYRWGNSQSYGLGDESDRQLYGQHYPYIIPSGLEDAGKLILFNNGSGRTPVFSEVMIIDPPTSNPGVYNFTSGIPYGPAAPDYIYDDPGNFFSGILSSALRLPNGNTLVCEGASGHFFELDSNENIVWDYYLPMNNLTGDIVTQGEPRPTNGNSTFRALKYSKNYVGFIDKDLTPGNPIETNFNNDVCESLSVNNEELLDLNIYPNPTDKYLNIETSQSVDKVEIYNLLGKRVGLFKSTNSIDISDIKRGIFILKLYSNNNITSRKIVKY